MPVRENTPERAGLRSAHPVSRLHHGAGRREGAGLCARSPAVHWRYGLSAGGRWIRTLGPPVEDGAWACFGGATASSGGPIEVRTDSPLERAGFEPSVP